MMVVVARGLKSRKKSKNRQKSKNLKGLKNRKGHRFRGTFTKVPILRQFIDRNNSVRALTVFRAPFAGPRSSLDTIFGPITDKAKLVEVLMLCRIFPVRGAKKIFEPRTLKSFTNGNQRFLCTKVCLQNARPPPAQFWRCAPEK